MQEVGQTCAGECTRQHRIWYSINSGFTLWPLMRSLQVNNSAASLHCTSELKKGSSSLIFAQGRDCMEWGSISPLQIKSSKGSGSLGVVAVELIT
uniref:Uncharacterized protein n=1 Tax=Oryza glumipatula TaxID=40148 RepID=A0A0D9Z4E6_9ORYZ